MVNIIFAYNKLYFFLIITKTICRIIEKKSTSILWESDAIINSNRKYNENEDNESKNIQSSKNWECNKIEEKDEKKRL